MGNQSIFETSTINCAKNALDYLSARHKAIASNVANVNTPGYKSKDVSFDSVLAAKNDKLSLRLTRTNPMHLSKDGEGDDGIDTFLSYGTENQYDGKNDVDLDKEMLKISEIQTNFTIFSDALKRKYDGIQKVISGTL